MSGQRSVEAFAHCLARVTLAVLCPLLLGADPYREAPMLTTQVEAGNLPPVAERLPEQPVVVQPVNRIGVYGGSWRRVALGSFDIGLDGRLAYESLVRWDRTGIHVVPGVASDWEVLDGGRTYVFHLRKGLRWSDGQLFTSEDLIFTYEDFLLNKELNPIFPDWLVVGGKPVVIRAPDPLTVEFHFAEPYGIFLEYLAFRGVALFHPKHYLKQFHPRYVDPDALNARARQEGFNYWVQLFQDRADVNRNPERPTLSPWVIKIPPPERRYVAERNPYYWKVDPEGNQLPYIDRIVYTEVQNLEMANFKAMTGDVDFQARRMDTANYALFMENREKGKYHVLRDFHTDILVVYLNQYSRDPKWRGLLQDRRFRIALSLAVNRPELIDLVYSGLAVPARGVGSPGDPFYLPEYDQKYLDYDPDRANALLDEAGLKRGRDGMRRMPDGGRFQQILHVYPSETGTGIEMWQLVADYWREVGLDFAVTIDAPTLSVLQVRNGNSDFWAYLTSGFHWIIDPVYLIPRYDASYFAPLYGQYVSTNGKAGVKPSPEFQQLVDWYHELCGVVNDNSRRLELGHRILGQWADECYTVGICRPEMLTIVSNRFKNVPDHILHCYQVMTPGYIGIEQFYIDPSMR